MSLYQDKQYHGTVIQSHCRSVVLSTDQSADSICASLKKQRQVVIAAVVRSLTGKKRKCIAPVFHGNDLNGLLDCVSTIDWKLESST